MARRSSSSNESDESRQVALDKALGDITKRYGDGAIMRLGEAHHMVVESIPTGALSLDIALGVGGIPRGRITEIYGPEFLRQDHNLPAHYRRSPAPGRHLRLRGYGTRPGSRLRSPLRR